MLPVQRCHYIRHVYWSGATPKYTCMYSATLSDMHAWYICSETPVCKVLLYQARYLVVTNSSDMHKIHPFLWTQRFCLSVFTFSCHSHGSVKLVGYHPGRHLEYSNLNDAWIASLGCYNDNVCNSRFSKTSILHGNPWSLSVLGRSSYIFL